MIYDKILEIREQLGVLKPTKTVTKSGGSYSYTPYNDLTSKLYPVLKQNRLFCKQISVDDGSDRVIIVTEIIDMDDFNQYIKDVSSMPVIKLQGLGELHSRMAIGTVLKRIGLINTLGLAFEDSDDNFETEKVSKINIATNSPEWIDIVKKLKTEEITLEDVYSKVNLTGMQRVELMKETSKF